MEIETLTPAVSSDPCLKIGLKQFERDIVSPTVFQNPMQQGELHREKENALLYLLAGEFCEYDDL